MSKIFMIAECILAAIFVIARGMGNIMPLAYGIVTLGVLLSIKLILCDDLISTLLPFWLICCLAIKCYDSFNVFIQFIWYAPIPAFALIFHLVVYRRKINLGKTWKGAAAVAVAVTCGGLGKITAAEYFSPTALYHTFGLGIGMFLLCILMNTYYKTSDKYVLRFRFSLIMTLVGVFCVFMIAHHYALFWENFMRKQSPIYFQWRNNVSTILMLAMPFPFYLSSKNYPFILVGFLQYAGILFTGSRGGALGGTVELALCLAVLIYSDVKNRKKNLIFLASAVTIAITFFVKPILDFVTPILVRLSGGDSIREGLIHRAVQDFKSNILFGRGLGYKGNSDVHNPAEFAICWYHSSPFQVIGSFGLVGVTAFAYQLYNRMQVIWKRITHFNITLFIAYAGLFLMSLVNPGEFCPIPYGLMATLLFIICDKNNIAAEISANKNDNEEILNIEI